MWQTVKEGGQAIGNPLNEAVSSTSSGARALSHWEACRSARRTPGPPALPFERSKHRKEDAATRTVLM